MSESPDNRTEDGIMDTDDPTLETGSSWVQVAQIHFKPESELELTTAIVAGIAEAEGVDPMEIRSPPLYEVVDVAAIEQSFFGQGQGANTPNATGSTQFRYNEYLVKVRSDGWVQVFE